jgi:diguanylate cyclase (GGDEF)-like protein/PAS domain S-box-containing protein
MLVHQPTPTVGAGVKSGQHQLQFVSFCTIETSNTPPANTPALANVFSASDDLPLSLLADLVNAVNDFVGTADALGNIIFLNRAARRMLEIPPDEDIRGQSVLPYNEVPTLEIQRTLERAVSTKDRDWTGLNVFVSRSGKRIPVSQTVVSHFSGGERCYSTIARDVTLELRAAEDLQWAADHDALTGLLNRSAFRLAVESAGARSALLVVLDLENFKQVNDAYGHHVGDQVLQRAAWVLKDTLGDRGITARLGGDEFAFTLFGDLEQAHEETLEFLNHELHRHLQLFGVGVRMGSAMLDLPNEPLDLTLKLADLDLCRYKKEQRSTGSTSGTAQPGQHQRQRMSSRHPRKLG